MSCNLKQDNKKGITIQLNEKRIDGSSFPGFFTNTRLLPSSSAILYPSAIVPSQWLSIELAPGDSVIGLFGQLHQKKIMLFDTNKNGSLMDEEPVPQKEDLRIRVRRSGYDDGDSIVFLTKFIPSIDLPGIRKYRDYTFSIHQAYRYGKAILDSVEYQFAYSNFSTDPKDPYRPNIRALLISPSRDSLPDHKSFPVFYKPGDSIYLGRSLYRFESTTLHGDSIVLTALGQTDNAEGIIVGARALPIRGTDARTGKQYVAQLTGKYTLLDFWGTWCGPCTELTPQLLNLYESKNRFSFQLLGIAYDSDRRDVINYMQKNEIPWQTLYDERGDNSRGTVFKYKIQSFPTFILIDPSGTIVFRSSGKEAFDQVKQILSKLQP
jgi:thiol-disulfide isomerase/thioredoxin